MNSPTSFLGSLHPLSIPSLQYVRGRLVCKGLQIPGITTPERPCSCMLFCDEQSHQQWLYADRCISIVSHKQSRAVLICGGALQIRLSDTASVAIKMPLKGRDGQPIQVVLTQQKFEELSADLFRRARLPLDEACWQVFLFPLQLALVYNCERNLRSAELQVTLTHSLLSQWKLDHMV